MKSIFAVLVTHFLLAVMATMAWAGNNPALKLKVLCDDTVASDKYLTEHGLSIFLELANGHQWLIDTGTTNIFLENAKLLNLSLDHLSGIAITHGHDDHTGGLTFYPGLPGSPPVYGHPYIWHKQYDISKDQPVRILGMPYLARKYAAPAFKPVNNVTQLDEHLYFFTDVYREPGSYTPVKGKFFNEDGTGPCPIIDDATVVIKTPRGLVAIFGCAHAGYVNILKAIKKEFPAEKLLAVVGGLHLQGAEEQVLSEALAATNEMSTADFTFYGGHCTGNKALAYFKNKLGDDKVSALGAGKELEF